MSDQPSRSPAFQFYADDFFAGTADMSQAETGAYIRLLCHQWNRGSIPVQTEKLERLAGGSVSDDVLAKFPADQDGARRNQRLELERQKQANYREMQRAKGIASGKARITNHGSTTAQPEFNHGSTEPLIRLEPNGNSPSPSPSPSPSLTPTPSPKPKQRPDGLREGELERAGRLGGLFGRRPDTAWSKKEVAKFREFIVGMASEDLDLLVWYYEQPGVEFRRKDLGTLLNNIPGELDRALAHKNRPPSPLDGANNTNTANGASEAVKAISPSVLIIQWTKELDDCQEKLDSIKDSYDGHQDWTIDDVNRYNRILGRKKELKKLLERKE